MATTPGFASASNQGAQDLFTVETDQFDKTVYTSVGSVGYLVLPTIGDSSGSTVTIGTDGAITLTADFEYLITATARLNNVTLDPAHMPLIGARDVTNFPTTTDIGQPVAIDQTYTATVSPVTDPMTIAIAVGAPNILNGGTWTYPAQVVNVSVTVQVIGGYTV